MRRYLDLAHWQIHTEFLCAVQVVDKSAAGMFKLLCAVLDALEIPLSKMAAICTDGDSTLMGRKTGLGARLREKVSYLLSVHCAAHKVALALKDTANNIHALQLLDKQLKKVHELFSKSGKRQQQWKSFARKRGVTAFQFPVHNTTRWFSRAQGVRVLGKNLPVLITFLQKKRNRPGWETADGLYTDLTDLFFVVLLYAAHDVLQPLENFRKYFERDGNLPHRVSKQLDACKRALDEIVGQPNSKSVGGAELQDVLKCVSAKTYVWKPTSKPGIKVQLRAPDEFSLEVVRDFLAELVAEVKENLDERFPELDILSAFRIFDPRTYSEMKYGHVKAFGSDEFKKLIKHFCGPKQAHRLFAAQESEILSALAEFARVKPLLWNAGQDGTSMQAFWRDLPEEDALCLRRVLIFVHVCFVVPMNSACAERGFSLHNTIKTKLRNRLRIPSLDALMRTRSQKVDYQTFNYEAAISMYHGKRGQSGLKLPKVFAAVRNECKGAETDSGDSEDMDGSDAFEDDSEGSMLMDSSDDESEQDEAGSEGLLGVGQIDPEDEAFVREMME